MNVALFVSFISKSSFPNLDQKKSQDIDSADENASPDDNDSVLSR